MNADYYNQNRGVASPLMSHGDIVCGFWMCGNNYRNKSTLYGAYPPCYLPRMKMLFPEEFKTGNILHLFSGSVDRESDREVRVDIQTHEMLHIGTGSIITTGPDVVGNAEEVDTMFEPGRFDLILADPPYDDNHIKYGTEKVNKKRVIKACATILKPGGFLVWLDTIMPIWSKADGWKLRGTIGLLQSTNHKVRVATILQKVVVT